MLTEAVGSSLIIELATKNSENFIRQWQKEPLWFIPRRYWILARVYDFYSFQRNSGRFRLGVEALEDTLIEPL